jgi:hypothetical protein
MKRVRNALGRLFRVNRGRASTPDSIAPFIRIVKISHVLTVVQSFPTDRRSTTEKAGGGDA